MKIFYCDQFVLPLPEAHRFPMVKYSRLRERVVDELIASDPERHGASGVTLHVPEAATDEQLLRAHDAEYVRCAVAGTLAPGDMRRIGFPWSHDLVERSRRSVGGTIGAARAALEEGVAANLAGGTHHAFADRGEGFCVFNDVAVAVRAMQSEGRASRAVVLDLDVHQGNGTASIFSRDPSVTTLSIHGANNFPFRKESSDIDVELLDRTEDAEYLAAVEDGVREAILRSGADLAFFLAGADPFLDDRLGRLSVTKEGLRRRDRIVYDRCRAAGIPVTVVMAGGYARDVEDTVDIHFSTIAAAAALEASAAHTGN